MATVSTRTRQDSQQADSQQKRRLRSRVNFFGRRDREVPPLLISVSKAAACCTVMVFSGCFYFMSLKLNRSPQDIVVISWIISLIWSGSIILSILYLIDATKALKHEAEDREDADAQLMRKYYAGGCEPKDVMRNENISTYRYQFKTFQEKLDD